jgi:hypothetical protein
VFAPLFLTAAVASGPEVHLGPLPAIRCRTQEELHLERLPACPSDEALVSILAAACSPPLVAQALGDGVCEDDRGRPFEFAEAVLIARHEPRTVLRPRSGWPVRMRGVERHGGGAVSTSPGMHEAWFGACREVVTVAATDRSLTPSHCLWAPRVELALGAGFSQSTLDEGLVGARLPWLHLAGGLWTGPPTLQVGVAAGTTPHLRYVGEDPLTGELLGRLEPRLRASAAIRGRVFMGPVDLAPDLGLTWRPWANEPLGAEAGLTLGVHRTLLPVAARGSIEWASSTREILLGARIEISIPVLTLEPSIRPAPAPARRTP